ncbi:major Facilitator Superfamily protein [Orientia chuto str. Dubai]|uniref:Major Facilitator Superfamily protein n=1 Tax=Orientia chuto str. Dubai TaxID=1359168 RepID=A0A0F3MN37_9RICK|nr:MFS transporter [Candidatus Orientia mediorientalis]KJV57178.1 major Facilitator Superfamily protein [Orientia chuto str. Dubai]
MNKKSLALSMLVTLAHYYDYYLFGLLASQISECFIVKSDSITQLKNTYLIMGMAILGKAIGAVILGRIGDLYGRNATFSISLIGTAGGSLLISILPCYDAIGVLSVFGLLLARISICMFTSPGTDGVRLYVYETIGDKYKCLGTGIVNASTNCGSFIASLSALFFTLDMMPKYSWRFAFILGGIFGGCVLIIRRVFAQSIQDDQIMKHCKYLQYKNCSIWQIIHKNLSIFILAILMAGTIGSTNQFCTIFFGTYVFKILQYLNEATAKYYVTLGLAIQMLFAIIGGYIADITCKKLVSSIAACCLGIVIAIIAYIINLGKFMPSLYLTMCMLIPFLTMPALVFLKGSIPQPIRYRLFSAAHACGSSLISGPTTFIATSLYQLGGTWWPMIYFFIIIAIMITVIYLLDYYSQKQQKSNFEL